MRHIPGSTLAVAAATLVAASPAVPAVGRTDANVSRKVIATEFKFRLPITSARTGTVTFMVQNKGKLPHDFRIAGKKSRMVKPGGNAVLKVTFRKKGRYAYVCTVPGHAAAGMKGKFVIR